MKIYDFAIIGAGLTGCTIARILADRGKKVVVFERGEIGGNCATKIEHGIEIHKHGAHTWHNSNPHVQSFMNRFADFRQYRHIKFVCHEERLYPFPISFDIFKEHHPKITEFDIEQRILNADTSSFEKYVISIMGREMYEKFYMHYTLKQWGTLSVPVSIAKRIPIRSSQNTNPFFDSYQAQPENYMKMFKRMLDGIDVSDGDFISNRKDIENIADKVVYTGSLDELFGYCNGALDYRTIHHDEVWYDEGYFQPCGTLNYTDDRPCLRSIEHKHFNNHSLNKKTVVTFEYPRQWQNDSDTRYYPMWDYDKYISYKKMLPENIIPAGRLGKYKYLDMNIAVGEAMSLANILL